MKSPNKAAIAFIIGAAASAFVACSAPTAAPSGSPAATAVASPSVVESAQPPESAATSPSASAATTVEGTPITITAGDAVFTATLNDSAAAQDFAATLPLTIPASRVGNIEFMAELPAPMTETAPSTPQLKRATSCTGTRAIASP